jgi:hypothetical protein
LYWLGFKAGATNETKIPALSSYPNFYPSQDKLSVLYATALRFHPG